MFEDEFFEYKPKSKIVSALLNILFFGAGYIYIGHFKKAIFMLLLYICSHILFFYVSTIYFNKYLLFTYFMMEILFYLYLIFDIIKIIDNQKDRHSNLFFTLFYLLSVYPMAYLIVFSMPIKLFKLPSKSMTPTIMKDEYFVAFKDKSMPRRGELIIYSPPYDSDKLFIKRCVAVGGDRIFIKNKNIFLHPREGDRYIKDNYSSENIIKKDAMLWIKNPYMLKNKNIHFDRSGTSKKLPLKLYNMNQLTIPENHLFILGDNRDHSNDSRIWGALPSTLLYGKPKNIFLNYNDFNRIGINPK